MQPDMLQQFIGDFKRRYPNNSKTTFHLIESNGLYEQALYLYFITRIPTAYIFTKTINNKPFIFIVI